VSDVLAGFLLFYTGNPPERKSQIQSSKSKIQNKSQIQSSKLKLNPKFQPQGSK